MMPSGSLGVDVSDYQGQVDWQVVAASGRTFAICKATEGIGFTCKTFARNWKGILEAGLVRGAYHFGRPDDNSPAAEVDHFLFVIDAAGGVQPGDLLALDLEDGTGDLAGWTLNWLRLVEARTGITPLLYSSPSFLARHNLTGPDLGAYPLWLASYRPDPPDPPSDWDRLTLWQHTDRAGVPGINGFCDESVAISWPS